METYLVIFCKKCGSKMVKRIKHSGENAGVEFWVCVKFPECKTFEKCDQEKVKSVSKVDLNTGKKTRTVAGRDYREKPHENSGMVLLIAGVFIFLLIGTFSVNLNSSKERQETSDELTAMSERREEQRQFTEQVRIPVQEKQEIEYNAAAENKRETSIIVQDNRIYVPVTLGYHGKMVTVKLLIDTGATGVTISPAIAQRLGIGSEATTQGISMLADGRKTINYNTVVDFVAVGPKTKKPLQIHIMPTVNNEETGLLGMSFLADFPHMLDLRSQVIRWM